jgi:iron complex transport system permease protein
MNSENLQGVLSWLNGSLSAKSWSHVRLAAMYGAARLGCAMLCLKSANTLQLGEEAAQSLGMKTGLARIALSAVAAFLAASSVSLVGVIGFVGLIVPHVARMFVGSNHKALMPGAMLLGACVMLTADLIGRTIAAPVEIPVGIVMSVLGGPFFLYLLRKQKQFGV